MKLTFEQIQAVTRGTVLVEEIEGIIRFHRMTEAQEQAYADRDERHRFLPFATSGVRLAFYSDTENIHVEFVSDCVLNCPFAFDCYEDGNFIRHFRFKGGSDPEGFKFDLKLSKGRKKIEIYLPYNCKSGITEMVIDDGSVIEPAFRSRTMFTYGDSITQGFDSHFPSLIFPSRLAALLDADLINKGIGGDRFFPPLLKEPDSFAPDIIAVAYGTNDWGTKAVSTIQEFCEKFYVRLSEFYPETPIFAITPFWRGDCESCDKPIGKPLSIVSEYIRQTAEKLENVYCISGDMLIPHEGDCYNPDLLHPNTLGASIGASNLYFEILKRLKA